MSSCISLIAKGYRTTSRWQGTPYFRRNGREPVSKPAISLKKSWGGYRRTTRPGYSGERGGKSLLSGPESESRLEGGRKRKKSGEILHGI